MRAAIWCIAANVALVACGPSSDDGKSASDTNAEAAAAFRTSWAGKDLTIAGSSTEAVSVCIRFTTLPGACRYTTRYYNYADDEAGSVVYADTCDIDIADSAVHIAVTCANPGSGGCREAEYDGDTPAIDMTNSNKKLSGSESEIVGLGDQQWMTGSGLCDASFAAATK
jgi:hypothetical protein